MIVKHSMIMAVYVHALFVNLSMQISILFNGVFSVYISFYGVFVGF